MIDPTPNVRKLAEAELYRAELEARRLARRLSLVGIAVFIALFAVIMLIVAGFLYLSELYGYPLGALITGGVLTVLAFVALVFAARAPGRADRLELELANQTIAQARAEVKRDFDTIERTLNDLTLGVLGLVKGGSGSLPLITIIVGAIAAMSPALHRFIMPFLRKD
ncbi:phage holin family protein [Parvibaculum sp.]|uniref:phage holin family protein n=1 Tax=Parvibaculum sp. TaxID=2024848 RepID=UPI001B173B5F|nr:phage holin family protein [Parvibaculum sp.]MBO6668095.1 phage holin family protein [Parvibaculum sp.]MBO6692007.1 phage holin family protein [Parvibaculum sp.]MBO6715589.1 phage holin family protein [Parvibaculum sp.]